MKTFLLDTFKSQATSIMAVVTEAIVVELNLVAHNPNWQVRMRTQPHF